MGDCSSWFGGLRAAAGLAVLGLLGLCGSLAGQTASSSSGENLALGKAYTLRPAPSYRYCTDPDDKIQLTDGKSTKGYFWTQKGTVGWNHAAYAAITVDLKRVEPIAAVTLTTAAGRANVQWPAEIHVQVSDDGKLFRDLGDLIAMDRAGNGPLPGDYAVRRLFGQVRARGRFVRFVMIPLPGSAYMFVDEVEVLRGDEALLQQEPAGEVVDDLAQFVRRGAVRRGVEGRWRADLDRMSTHLQATVPDAAARRPLEDRLAEIRKELLAAPVPDEQGFRAILPIGPQHARLFALQADLWRQLGRPKLAAWPANAWDPLELFAMPPDPTTSAAGELQVHSMLGEYRSAAINLANAGTEPLLVRLNFQDLPGRSLPDYVTAHEVQWTDTSLGEPVAAALPKADRDSDVWVVPVLPGMVRQVWFTFHVQDLPGGSHTGRLVIRASGMPPIDLAVKLRVWPIQFPARPSLWLGGWCYTDGKASRGITDENREAFVRHLQSHFVNAPWAAGATMLKCTFSGQQPDVVLDTERFDEWAALWPQAERYMVFLSVGSSLGGKAMGTPEFDRCVAAWINAWVAHLRTKGIGPDRLALLLLDEPHEGKDFVRIVNWAKAIHAAQPNVVIWEDPTWRDPVKAPAEVFSVCDVLCPNRPMWLAQGKPFADFFLRQQSQGKKLEFYSCSGPARLLDPYSYYRLQAWHCWQIGALGSYFWAFSDNSGVSSWNEYLAKSGPYTPLFLDESSVVAGKQMEAIRESVEDYEYFAMLRQAVQRAKAAGRGDAAVADAEQLLAHAADEVLADQTAEGIRWHTPKDRTRADAVRVRLLEAIGSLGHFLKSGDVR